MTQPQPPAPASPHWLARLSRLSAVCETIFAGGLLGGIFALLLANVVSRAVGRPLIWTDELAVYLMIWLAFAGASVGLARRQHIAMTLATDALSDPLRRKASLAVDVLLLGFFVVLGAILWLWFDPVTLLRAGSADAFAAKTFNFLYQEPTTTLGTRKVWFWLILPYFCAAGLLHCAGRLMSYGKPS